MKSETKVKSETYSDSNVKSITKTAIMAALVFLATYVIKIPSPNGYTHLGDCLIFVAVLILGSRRGALAGGLGAALADLMGGYAQWVLPSFFIKGIMAFIMGAVTYKLFPKLRFGWLIGALVGGVVQIALYTLVKIPMYGLPYAITRLPGLVLQTIFGVIIAAVIIAVLNESSLIKKLREV